MNRIFSLCWNRALGAWVPAPEFARQRGARAPRQRVPRWMPALLLSASMAPWMAAAAGTAAPTGGQVVAGEGRIEQAGNVTTITQGSAALLLNWQRFDVGANQTVDFVQPGAGSIAVNRILGNTASEIYGHLNANGQVWLINPNGVLFGKSARVNVAGLVASTLAPDGDGADAGTVRFSGSGSAGVINQGEITAAPGGYVALLGNTVLNQGTIRAQLGTVALAGGSAMTLTFADSHLLHVVVTANTLRSLVANGELIVADGGQVLMTAGARNSLIASAVNNSGTVEARTVSEHDGTITLLGGMAAGTVGAGGTLDASAPDGGNGGRIETSAAHLELAADARITAAAPAGQAGTWRVDPVNLTVDAAAAGTLAATLNGGTNVVEQTTASGASGSGTQSAGAGDIVVNAGISWNSPATLTLDAYHDIQLNAAITNAGGGSTVLEAANAFTNNVGGAALGGHWVVYSASPAGDTLGGLAPAFIQYNAAPGSALDAGGNALAYATAPTLTITGLVGSVSKDYDATTAANGFSGANFTSSGLVGGDTISAAAGGSYAQANVGSGINVTTPGAIADFAIVNNGVPVYGYALGGSPVTAAVGTINPKLLVVNIVNNPTKVYDGTTTATLTASNYQITGWMGSDANPGNGAIVGQPSSVAYVSPTAGVEQINATFTVTNFKAQGSTQLSNYTLPSTGTGSGTIEQAPLAISGLLADDKVYDGTTAATLSTAGASLYGVIQPDVGDVALVTGGMAGTFAQANVGSGIAVAVSGYALSGSKAADYRLVAPADLTASITPKSLTITQVTANDKPYDATTNATLNTGAAVLNGVIGGDQVTLNASAATGQFSQADVGTNLGVTDSGFALAGSGKGNYTLTQPTQTASITQAPLGITLTGTPEKSYDGTNAVLLGSGNFDITGFVGAQSATIFQSSATYATAHAGTGIDVTAALQPSDFTPAAGTLMSNYSFPATVTGVGIGKIDPLQLTGAIVNNPTKVYDGNNDALLTASNLVVNGALPGQAITASFAGSKTITGTAGTGYADANAGAWGITAPGSAFGAGDFSAGGGALLSDYLLPTVWTGSGTITPAPLSGQVISAGIGRLDGGVTVTKVYDGTTAVTLNGDNFVLHGFVGSDGATVNNGIAGTFGQADVGTDLPLSAQLTMGDLTATGSTNLGNYSIQNPALGVGNITPAPLTVTIIGTPTKVYNGSNLAALTSANFQITGWATATGEGGSINPTATATYNTANVNANTITAVLTPGNYVPNANTKLSNYTPAYSATGPGAITPAPLYVTGVYAKGKTYDTTASDTLNLAAAGLAGLVSSDTGQVTLGTSGAVAQFVASDGTTPEASAGTWGVAASGFTLSGSQAFNYVLQPVTGLSATIQQAPLTVTGVTAQTKPYDGTQAATLNVAGAGLAGVLGSDDVVLDSSGYSASFANANAGTWGVSASGFTLGGTADGNYTLQQPTGLSATINPATLTAEIIGTVSKMYDGSDSATLTAANYQLTGFMAGQGASVPQSATANYATVNAGTGLTVNSTLVVSDFVANAGTNLANYILPTAGSGTIGTITPYVLNLTASRVYDGTTNASATAFGNGGTLDGIKGQTVTLSGTGQTSSKNVGTYPGFDISGFALGDGGSGGLAQNYTLTGGVDTFTITPRPLTATFDASSKPYDGNRNDTLANAALVASTGGNSGLITGDAVTLTNPAAGTFDTKDAGVGKTVTGAMGITGADAGNYAFTNGTATANITQLGITVTATGKDKVYDGTTADPGLTLASAGVLTGDAVSFTGTSAFADPNVGNGIAISVTGIAATGADAGNYSLLNGTAATSANITPYQINLSASRVYDGSTDAGYALFAAGGVLATGVNGETLTLSGQGTTADKNVATGKLVTLGTLALSNGASGNLASNYQLAGAKLTITKRALTNLITASDKVYDGTTAATLTSDALVAAAGGSDGLIAGDQVTLTNAAAGTFATKNVGKGITVTGGAGITGTDAGNYAFTNATTTADITKRDLTVTATGSNKPYDGNANAAVTLGSDAVAGDVLTLTDTSATYGGSDAGSYTITVAGIGVGGAAAGNYHLLDPSTTTTGTINRRVLDLSGSRTYDGTATAATGTFAGFFGIGTVNGDGSFATGVGSESLMLTGPLTLSSKDAATYSDIPNNGFVLGNGDNGGKASNYAIGTIDYVINPVVLNLSGTRGYDGTVNADAGAFGSNGVLAGINGETVDLTGTGQVANKNAGSKPLTSLGSLVLANGGNGGLAGNYTLAGGSDTLNITQKTLTASVTAANKVYDATTAATLTSLTGNGVIAGDTVTVGDTGATFGDANVGNGKTVTVTGLTLGGADAGNYALPVTTVTTTANITPYVLNLAGTRAYDGSTDAAAGLFGVGGVLSGVAGQTLTLSGTGQAANKNVAKNQPLAGLGSLTLGDGTGLAGNYTLVGGTDTLTITAKGLDVTGIAANKVYDGTTAATLTSLTEAGVIAGDAVTLSDSGATFADANVGNGKTVTITGLTLGGADAGNYALPGATVTATADITPYVLNLAGTRTYDGTVDAAADLFGAGGVLAGIAGQTLALAGTGHVADKNVGKNKPFADLGSLTLGDGTGLAANYTLVGGTDTLSITPMPLTVSVTAANKMYDATTAATLTLVTGALPGDVVTPGDNSATFADANVGNGKTVTVTGLTLGGADAGNYALTATTATTTADITPYVLNLAGTRVYDGTVDAAADLFGAGGVLTGVAGQTLALSGTGQVADKNVGSNKPLVDLGSLTLADGTDLASNYTLLGGTDVLSITPRALGMTATAQDRVYDGTDVIAIDDGALVGLLAGDQVTLAGDTQGTVADKNVGTHKAVTVDATIAGADAGNYSLTPLTGLFANITPKSLSVSATAANKVYDATTAATLTSLTGTGLIAGDTVTFGDGGANFADANVGNGKTVTVTGLTLGGADAGNYTLAGTTATTTADITPKPLGVSATAANKVYDATTAATLTSLTGTGVIAGDTVTFGDGGASFADANVGNGKTVTVTGLTLGGADAGNYTLASSTATTTADITPYVLNLAGTRVYDGSTDAAANLFGAGGVLAGVAGQTLTLAGTGQVAGRNVGSHKPLVALGSLTLGDGTGLAGNYTLAGGTDTLSITPKPLTVSVTAANKVYDGNTTATLTSLTGNGLVAGDTLTFGYATANFSDPNVGDGKTVTASGITDSGIDAANYTLVSTTATTTADITAGVAPPRSALFVTGAPLAVLNAALDPFRLPTPYGLAGPDVVGIYVGNQKRLHRPVERNVSRRDFTSGLALRVVDGGVRMPGAHAAPHFATLGLNP